MKRFGFYILTAIVFLAFGSVFQKNWINLPNLSLIFVILVSLRSQGKLDFLWLAFCTGLLLDTTSSVYFGTYTSVLLIVSFVVFYSTKIFLSADHSLPVILGISSVAYLLFVGLFFFANSMAIRLGLEGVPVSGAFLEKKIWINLLGHLIATGPVFVWLNYLDQYIDKIEQREHLPHV